MLKLQYFGHLIRRADSSEKALMLGKTEGRRRRGRRDEMARQYHRLNGHEFEKTPGDSGGQRSLACYSPRAHKELDKIYQMNNNNHSTSYNFPETIKCRDRLIEIRYQRTTTQPR